MEANIDNFINYTDSPSLFLAENFPDLDFGFRSPETEISVTNNPPITTPSHSSAPSNHFSNGHSMRGPASHTGSGHRSPDTMTSSPDDESRYNQTTASISTNSKKIHKRNKEEKKLKTKQELEQLLATTARKYIPEGIDDPNLDDKTKRKMVQMVKNRVAAQKTRDKRKNYMSELEEVKFRLDEANRQLNERNKLLEQRVRDLENAQAQLMAENKELKRGGTQLMANSQPRSMQQQVPHPQQMQYPGQPIHPNMQQPQPNMQPMINSPHYPSLPATPQHMMQARFQSMNSISSFDGYSFPQSNIRLNPTNNNYNNPNNSHTAITIENNNDNSQNSHNSSNGSNTQQQQQFMNPFPVLSRGSSGKRNTYGYLLAITMVLACFTTLNSTGKIVVQKNHTDGGDDPSDHPAVPSPPGDTGFGPDPEHEPETTDTDPSAGTGGGETQSETDDGGDETQSETFTDPEADSGTDNDPTVVSTDVSTPSHNGTGTNGNNGNDGNRTPKSGGEGSSGSDPTVSTFSTTSEGTDDGTDSGTDNSFGPQRFRPLDNANNNTNITNSSTEQGSSGQSLGFNGVGVGRILVLTEILDEIEALNRDY